jgi:hypothetical protein
MSSAFNQRLTANLGGALFCLVVLALPAFAQDEGALREAFEGKVVAPRMDMPGSSDGVTISLDERPSVDFGKVQASLKLYGVAIANGRHATVTRLKVKKSVIEVQLGGGGYGTLGDLLNDGLGDSIQVARLRADGGSRFNIRFKGVVPSRFLHADTLRIALAKYLDFDPPVEVVAPHSVASAPPGGPASDQPGKPTVAPTLTPRLAWTPLVGWDGEIFPSYIIATAGVRIPPEDDPQLIGDPLGIIRVRIVAPTSVARVRVKVSSPGLMEESSLDTLLAAPGGSYLISPTIAWDFHALARVRQARPATVTVTVSVDGEEVGRSLERATLHSINDAPYFVTTEGADGKQKGNPTSWMFAAYVNENSPVNDEIRRQALQAGIVKRFDGYQSGDVQQVIRQVYAMWNVMQRLGMKYSSITTTTRASSRISSQQVRFVEQSVKSAQANCVDGSVLFASLMREVGIDPVLVLLPGHMYVGFYLDQQHTEVFYLETTLLGQADLRPEADPWGLGRLFNGDQSWATFTQAWQYASEDYTRSASEFGKPGSPYQRIDIDAARQLGILPIAYSQ